MFLVIFFYFALFPSNCFGGHEFGELLEKMNEFDAKIVHHFIGHKICDKSKEIVHDGLAKGHFDPKFQLCQTIVSMGNLIHSIQKEAHAQNQKMSINIFRRIMGTPVKDDKGKIKKDFEAIHESVLNDLHKLIEYFERLVNNENKVNKLKEVAGMDVLNLGFDTDHSDKAKMEELREKDIHYFMSMARELAKGSNMPTMDNIKLAFKMLWSGDLVRKEFNNCLEERITWAFQQMAVNLVAYDMLHKGMMKSVLTEWLEKKPKQ